MCEANLAADLWEAWLPSGALPTGHGSASRVPGTAQTRVAARISIQTGFGDGIPLKAPAHVVSLSSRLECESFMVGLYHTVTLYHTIIYHTTIPYWNIQHCPCVYVVFWAPTYGSSHLRMTLAAVMDPQATPTHAASKDNSCFYKLSVL